MDKFQTAERERTIRNAISSASRYLDNYPGRTVSLLLAPSTTLAGISAISATANTVSAVRLNNAQGFTASSSIVTVSVHDIIGVSEDDADIVTDQTRDRRAADICDAIMAQFDAKARTSFFFMIKQRFAADHGPVDNTFPEVAALRAGALRAHAKAAVLDMVMTYYRPNIDFSDWRRAAIFEAGLS